jgi:hypothetical protein
MRWIAIAGLAVLLGVAAAHAAGKTMTARRLALPDVTGTVPAGWTPVPPGGMGGRFRLAQYRLPRAAGDPADPEVIVYYFGPGGGGTVPANLERWKGQFESPAGQAAKTAERTRDGLRITTIDLHGTYKERATPMSASFTPRANYRMVAAAVETTRPGGQGPYWIRLVGPAKSVAAQRSVWEVFLASLRPK